MVLAYTYHHSHQGQGRHYIQDASRLQPSYHRGSISRYLQRQKPSQCPCHPDFLVQWFHHRQNSWNIHIGNGNHRTRHVLITATDSYKGIHVVTPIAASIESAMISRDVKEKRIPGVPMAIPSATVMVPNCTGQAPASLTPSLANFPKSCRWMLQGVFSAQVEITPTIGFSKSFFCHSSRTKHGTVW